MKPGIDKRLEASIETATRLADGLVLISVVDGAGGAGNTKEERLYSQKLACLECGASVPELEPRSFSFNSPYGACEECAGIGSTWAFDPDKIVVDLSKPLLEGALGPGAGSSRVTNKVQEVAKALRAKLKNPWGSLPLATRDALLTCIVATLDDIYRDAPARYGEWLTEYMSPVPCPACGGKRLRPGSLAVRVKNISIAEFTSMPPPVPGALISARSWQLTERENQIAGRVVDEIRRRLEFLESVGLHYLSLDRAASTLSGGEAQRIRLATQIGSKLRGVLWRSR